MRIGASCFVGLLVLPLAAAVAQDDGFQPFRSEVMRGGQPAKQVRVKVDGLEEIWLIAVGVPNNGCVASVTTSSAYCSIAATIRAMR